MSKNFPPAAGATINLDRRRKCPCCGTSANPDPLSDFCASITGQRSVDIDMIGLDERTGAPIWVMEAAGLRRKVCTLAFHLADQWNVPLIYVYYNFYDHEHTQPISYHTHIPPRRGGLEADRRIFSYENVSWKKLEYHLKWIARVHDHPQVPEHYAVSFTRQLSWDTSR